MIMEGADYTAVCRSPEPQDICCYSPSVIRHKGRIVVSMDIGGKKWDQMPGAVKNGVPHRGMIFISDDDGKSFSQTDVFPFIHARLFEDNGWLYLLGHSGDLKITRSKDGGLTWEDAVTLVGGGGFHASPNNVLKYNGHIYLAVERTIYDDVKAWQVSVLAPILMRAKEGSDLTDPASWTYSEPLAFRDAVSTHELDWFGVPFYNIPEHSNAFIDGVSCAPIGWLETNVVKIYDKRHYWYAENAFHLFLRAHTAGTGYACMMKVVEQKDGSMKTEVQRAPSGIKTVFVPMPGGQMKFHVIYDEKTELYWLLSTQATDSMTQIKYLSKERFSIPNNERHRLQLHFSTNMADWCFACMVDAGAAPRQSRHYAAMDFDGDDIIIASRSGDKDSADAHNSNMISFHRIKDFRRLIY